MGYEEEYLVRIYRNGIKVGDTVVAMGHGFDYSPYGDTSGTHNYKSGDTGIVESENDDFCFNVRFSNGVCIPGCWEAKFRKVDVANQEVESPDTKVWATRKV
jgi:hypothetical protein